MDIQYKDNGNILVDGKEYIPRERLENAIDEAVSYGRTEKIKKAAVVSISIITLLLVSIIRNRLK